MPLPPQSQTASFTAPFDWVADDYDQTFTASTIGQAQRRSVWRELEKTFYPGQRILEVGCGTGVDACFLAEQGVHVVACDSSSQMVRVAEKRLAAAPPAVQSRVELRVLCAERITNLTADGPFDGAFSNFGAINCLSDLESFSKDLSSLLKPGASILLCTMGPCCAWEILWYLGSGRPAKAFRRLRRGGVDATIGNLLLHVEYAWPHSVARSFAPHFRLQTFKGVGLTVPPTYLEPWVRRVPRLMELASRVDSLLESCSGLRVFGDHILLKLKHEGL